ncbi:MAG: hypothetical protein ABIQ52_20365 [Vicinamibacterales bacterium]
MLVGDARIVADVGGEIKQFGAVASATPGVARCPQNISVGGVMCGTKFIGSTSGGRRPADNPPDSGPTALSRGSTATMGSATWAPALMP